MVGDNNLGSTCTAFFCSCRVWRKGFSPGGLCGMPVQTIRNSANGGSPAVLAKCWVYGMEPLYSQWDFTAGKYHVKPGGLASLVIWFSSFLDGMGCGNLAAVFYRRAGDDHSTEIQVNSHSVRIAGSCEFQFLFPVYYVDI